MSTTANRNDAARPAAPAGVFTHREVLTIIVGLMLAIFLAALDQTVVATATRTIADDLAGFSLQAWATTAFLITSTITTPLYGKLSDIYGRKPFLLASISIFIAGSALCGLARSMYELAAFRAVQGIGAGGVFPLALIIIGDIVPPRDRSRYQGYFLATFGAASVLGPVIGGALAGQGSIAGISGWRWIFYVNVPIGLVTLAVVTRVLHLPRRTGARHRIDWPGALALIVCLVPLLTVAEQGRQWGWGSNRALACYAIGAVGLAAFLVIERVYADEALLPMRLFRGRTFSVAGANSIVVGMGMFGAIGILPQYLQIVKGSSPTVAGLQMIPLMLGVMTGSIIAGQAIGRTGRYKVFPLAGATFMTVALLLFHLVGADTPLWRTMLVMILFGLGVGGTMQPVVLAVQNAASPRETGVATSSVPFFRQVGGTLGTAVFLSILFSTLTGRITDAMRDAAASPDFQAALRAHPDQVHLLQDGAQGALTDTSFISRLDDVLARPFRVGFSSSMDLVFLIAAGVVLIAVVVTLFLPQLPLRRTSGIQAEQNEVENATAAS
jgi:EmrB/QacA subfamily drug resistance transporter